MRLYGWNIPPLHGSLNTTVKSIIFCLFFRHVVVTLYFLTFLKETGEYIICVRLTAIADQ